MDGWKPGAKMSPKSYCKHRPVSRPRHLISRIGGLGSVVSSVGVWVETPAEIKIDVISAAKYILLIRLFLSNH